MPFSLRAFNKTYQGNPYSCECVVHKAFAGVLQSDVTCLQCGNVSVAFDPLLDISLDILIAESQRQELLLSHDDMHTLDSASLLGPLTLRECLLRFTRAERLGSSAYMCSNCNHTYQVFCRLP